MAQTIADLSVTTTWQSVNTLSSIAIGAAFTLQNKSIHPFILAEGTEPSSGNKDGKLLDTGVTTTATSGSLEVWVRGVNGGGNLHVGVV